MKHKYQKGLNLIELMIAMIIGLLIVGTVITIFITSVRSNTDHLKMLRLNQEMRAVMSLITRELKLANADDTAISSASVGGDYLCSTPACSLDVSPSLDNISFDVYENGGIVSKSFALANEAVTFDPGSGNAESLTGPDNDVLNLVFDADYLVDGDWAEDPPTDPTVTVDAVRVTITLEAETELSGDDSAIRTLNKTIRVRN